MVFGSYVRGRTLCSEDPQHEQSLDASDLAWVEKMLILAGEEQEQPSTKAYDMDDDELWLSHMLKLSGEERSQP